MNDRLHKYLHELDSLDESRNRIAMAAFEELSAGDSELAALALEAFQTPQAAANWFTRSVMSLGNERPLRFVADGKREQVLNCLNVIKHGMWA